MKSVSFQPENTDSSPSAEPLSPEEIQAIWYSPKELAEIRSDCQAIIDGDKINNEEIQVRGLEKTVSDRGGKWQYPRNDVIIGILEAQERLKQTQADDEKTMETLAEIESRHSQHHLRIAHLRALQDAQVAHGTVSSLFPRVDCSQIRQKRRSARQQRRQSGLANAE